MTVDLTNRKWPLPHNVDPRTRDKPETFEVLSSYYAPYVREGYTICRRLGIWGVQRTIPDGESAVTSLAVSEGGVFGGTSGRRAHVFGYVHQPHFDCVFPMAVLEEDTAIRHAMVNVPGEGVFGGTSGPGLTNYAGGRIFKIRPRYPCDVIQEWAQNDSEIEFLATPVPGEGIDCLVYESIYHRLYGLTDGTGELFFYDFEKKIVQRCGPIDAIGHFSRDLVADCSGRIWGASAAGRLVCYDPAFEKLERHDLSIPCFPGRSQYSRVEAWAVDGNTGIIYGGDVADGLLFRFDPSEERIQPLGKPTAQHHIRALTVLPDGRVYGVCGPRDGMAHLFVYNNNTHEMRDLGVLTAALEERWYGYEFDCMGSLPDGRILLGESDRIGHVFCYFPPQLK